MKSISKDKSAKKPRPKLFRALGNSEPPQEIEVEGQELQLDHVVKHDSWAATAIYGNSDISVVCKFNRTQRIGFVPMKWLGRILANRENQMYQRLSDLESIPNGYQQVLIDGVPARNTAAHEFIEGNPLRWHDKVNDTFFSKLLSLLRELHRRDIAYVDLNKSENIIKDESGDPYLIDFQISMRLPQRFPMNVWPASWVSRRILRVLQRCDLYHLAKMVKRFRPDLIENQEFQGLLQRPWWIRAHRKIGVPLRTIRRRLLVLIGIRSGKGKPHSEFFIEEGLRASSGEPKPIMKLYRLLMSDDYVATYGETPETFHHQLMKDLCGNVSDRDIQRNRPIRSASNHDMVVEFLRSDVVHRASNQWSDQWAGQKVAAITKRFATTTSDRKAA